jgi:hypothetical protein
MNAVQKLLPVAMHTLLLILFACASLYGATGTRHVFYEDSGGHVHQLYSTASGWSDVDLTALTNAPIAELNSGYSTGLTSVLDGASNYVHVYYVGGNQHVYELYGTGTTWHYDDPTALAGGVAAEFYSGLTSIIGTGSIIHIFYYDSNYTLQELYWLGGTTWHHDSPAALAGQSGKVPGYNGAPLTSFMDFSHGNNFMHVFCPWYNDQNNVSELYWIGGSAWHYDSPMSLAGAPTPEVSNITSFIDNSNNSAIMHLFYEGGNQHIYELYYTGTWHYDDTTSLAGAPVAEWLNPSTPLTSFLGTVNNTGMHVLYLGTNHHVYELHWTTAWSSFDATAASGGVPADPYGGLTSFQDRAGGNRVYFVGTNNHVYELYWQNEPSASETDLTVASGGTLADLAGLSGVVGP